MHGRSMYIQFRINSSSLPSRYDELRDPTSPVRESVREQHRKTLRQALHVWLDQFPEDFQVCNAGVTL